MEMFEHMLDENNLREELKRYLSEDLEKRDDGLTEEDDIIFIRKLIRGDTMVG